jgi:hypothetical protein
VFEATGKTMITVALDPALAAGVEATGSDTDDTNTDIERRTAVKHETNGHPPNGRHDPPDVTDPLAAAEELRAALGDALAAAGRLVAALRQQRKEKKALASVYAGLKALNLDGEGRS